MSVRLSYWRSRLTAPPPRSYSQLSHQQLSDKISTLYYRNEIVSVVFEYRLRLSRPQSWRQTLNTEHLPGIILWFCTAGVLTCIRDSKHPTGFIPLFFATKATQLSSSGLTECILSLLFRPTNHNNLRPSNQNHFCYVSSSLPHARYHVHRRNSQPHVQSLCHIQITKGKGHPHDMPMQAQRAAEHTATIHSQPGSRRTWMATFHPGKTRHQVYRGLGGPRDRSGRHGKSSPHRDSIPGPSSP